MTLFQLLENLKQQLLKMKIQLNSPPQFIIVHHPASDVTLLEVNEYHQRLWNFKSSLGWYAGYGWWIDLMGKKTQLRDDREEQAHTIGFNKKSVGICCQGNFDKEQPTKAQLYALSSLINELAIKYQIPNSRILGHREVSNTSCPGKNLFSWLCKNYPSLGKTGYNPKLSKSV